MIIIDGVVGCGKTTLGKKLSEYLNIPMQQELQKKSTMQLLERFYADKKRWSFTLQIHFLNERFRMIKEIGNRNEIAILDRSIFGDKIFASMLNEDGFMSDEEFETYATLLDNMLEHVTQPHQLIYIECDVPTAIHRINKRGRTMELSTPNTYWERLNEKYSEWYKNYEISEKISINATSYNPENKADIMRIADLVKIEKAIAV